MLLQVACAAWLSRDQVKLAAGLLPKARHKDVPAIQLRAATDTDGDSEWEHQEKATAHGSCTVAEFAANVSEGTLFALALWAQQA